MVFQNISESFRNVLGVFREVVGALDSISGTFYVVFMCVSGSAPRGDDFMDSNGIV